MVQRRLASISGLPLPGSVDHFHQADLEAVPLPVDPFNYDAILLLDVIEELKDPEGFLVHLRNRSEVTTVHGWKPPMVLVSTPNIGHWAMRLNLLMGRFTYSERGILALAHKRLFTKRTFKRCLRDSGYQIEKLIPVGIPYHAVFGNNFGWFLGPHQRWLCLVLAKYVCVFVRSSVPTLAGCEAGFGPGYCTPHRSQAGE